jgi:hypothetical protein
VTHTAAVEERAVLQPQPLEEKEGRGGGPSGKCKVRWSVDPERL